MSKYRQALSESARGRFLPALQRLGGGRILIDSRPPLEQILFGPSSLTDGTLNLVGALRNCMGIVGAMDLREMHDTEMMLAPSIKTEGKIYQRAQAGG